MFPWDTFDVPVPPFDYFDYYNVWRKFMTENKDANILSVNYEDLKQVLLTIYTYWE